MADFFWSPESSLLKQPQSADSYLLEKEKNNGPEGGMISEGLSSKIQAKRGGGVPLSSGMLEEYQAQFNRNLKDVRIHQDAEADAMNESLNAGAFTIGWKRSRTMTDLLFCRIVMKTTCLRNAACCKARVKRTFCGNI